MKTARLFLTVMVAALTLAGCSKKNKDIEQPETVVSLTGEWKITSMDVKIEGLGETDAAKLEESLLDMLEVYEKGNVLRFNESGSLRDGSGLGAYCRVDNTLLMLHGGAIDSPAFYFNINSLDETKMSITMDMLSEKIFMEKQSELFESYPGLTGLKVDVEAKATENTYTENDSEEFDTSNTFTSCKDTAWFAYDTQLVTEGLTDAEIKELDESMGGGLVMFNAVMMNSVLIFRSDDSNAEIDGKFYSSVGGNFRGTITDVSDTACVVDLDFDMGVNFTDKGAGNCSIWMNFLYDEALKAKFTETYPNLKNLGVAITAAKFRSKKVSNAIADAIDNVYSGS